MKFRYFDDDIKHKITSFYSLVSNLDTKELPQIYRLGNELYQHLLEKILKKINTKEIIVLADDVLNYLPFEALSLSGEHPEYLIKKYQISHANSLTLLKEQIQVDNKVKNTLLAYAPSFDEKENEQPQQVRSDLGPLLYNKDEAKAISTFFNGKTRLGSHASLDSFIKDAKNHNILHFATHAAANDEYPDYSYLAFAPDHGQRASLLYVKDLYGYHLNADLVTLSACQTGLGKLEKGEGMLSLARGFSYSGAKSLATTLWKINDQTTSELMLDFYKNLDAALPKDQALRAAKLAYLDAVDDELLAHPYYWSGFMISGDTAPLKTANNLYWWLLLLGIPVLIIVIRKIQN